MAVENIEFSVNKLCKDDELIEDEVIKNILLHDDLDRFLALEVDYVRYPSWQDYISQFYGKYNTNFYHLAARYDAIKIIKYLYSEKVRRLITISPNKPDKFGQTPIFYAVQYGHYRIINFMLDFLPSPAFLIKMTSHIDNDGDTPLFLAFKQKNFKMLMFLVEKRADVNRVNGAGETLLLRILKDYPMHVEVIAKIVSYRADVNLADPEGNTPLMVAAQLSAPSVIRMLLAFGANVNSKNNCKDTALNLAFKIENYENGLELLRLGVHFDDLSVAITQTWPFLTKNSVYDGVQTAEISLRLAYQQFQFDIVCELIYLGAKLESLIDKINCFLNMIKAGHIRALQFILKRQEFFDNRELKLNVLREVLTGKQLSILVLLKAYDFFANVNLTIVPADLTQLIEEAEPNMKDCLASFFFKQTFEVDECQLENEKGVPIINSTFREDDKGWLPLHHAVATFYEDFSVFEALIIDDPNGLVIPDKAGVTPVALAALKDPRLLIYLLKNRERFALSPAVITAIGNARDRNGGILLHYFAQLITSLYPEDAQAQSEKNNSSEKLLNYFKLLLDEISIAAFQEMLLEMVKVLLKFEIDVNAENAEGLQVVDMLKIFYKQKKLKFKAEYRKKFGDEIQNLKGKTRDKYLRFLAQKKPLTNVISNLEKEIYKCSIISEKSDAGVVAVLGEYVIELNRQLQSKMKDLEYIDKQLLAVPSDYVKDADSALNELLESFYSEMEPIMSFKLMLNAYKFNDFIRVFGASFQGEAAAKSVTLEDLIEIVSNNIYLRFYVYKIRKLDFNDFSLRLKNSLLDGIVDFEKKIEDKKEISPHMRFAFFDGHENLSEDIISPPELHKIIDSFVLQELKQFPVVYASIKKWKARFETFLPEEFKAGVDQSLFEFSLS